MFNVVCLFIGLTVIYLVFIFGVSFSLIGFGHAIKSIAGWISEKRRDKKDKTLKDVLGEEHCACVPDPYLAAHLSNRITATEQALKAIEKSDLTDCHTCGCAVIKKDENKGEGVIRFTDHRVTVSFLTGKAEDDSCGVRGTDYIHYDYYCKRCNPRLVVATKSKKKGKK